MSETEVYIEGKDRKTAARLLFLAGEHDLDPHVVRTGDDGFYVPEVVAEAFKESPGDEEEVKPRRRGARRKAKTEPEDEKSDAAGDTTTADTKEE